jgi:hypothetical protein
VKVTTRIVLDNGHVAYEDVDRVEAEGEVPRHIETEQAVEVGGTVIDLAAIPFESSYLVIRNTHIDPLNFVLISVTASGADICKLTGDGAPLVLPVDAATAGLTGTSATEQAILDICAVRRT